MNALVRFFRIRLCRHVCDLSTLHTIGPDYSDERVEATCSKCGNKLRAPYGMALPCKWTNKPNAPVRRGTPSPQVDGSDGRCPTCRQRDSHAGEREADDGSVIAWHCNVSECSNNEDHPNGGGEGRT